MFRDREDAASRLASELKGRKLHDPLVLAIPRGGIVTGAVLARELGADLDVVLSRKLRAPGQPELAIGAISEDGSVYMNHHAEPFLEEFEDYLAEEQRHELAEIARRKKLFRAVRPQAARSPAACSPGLATRAAGGRAARRFAACRPHAPTRPRRSPRARRPPWAERQTAAERPRPRSWLALPRSARSWTPAAGGSNPSCRC